jgi:amino acid adenylation domain-containing protein
MVHNSPLSEVIDQVATGLGIAEKAIDDNTDLLQLGLDSINMMRLAGHLQRAGHKVTFADLVTVPTLAAWRELLQNATPSVEPVSSKPLAVDEQAPFDLALMQHAYWVGRGEGQHLGGVAAHYYNEFDGAGVDPGRLETAVRALFMHHGMLRVQVLEDGRQQVPANPAWPGLTVYDFRNDSARRACERLDELRDFLSHRRMEISAGEVFDIRLSLLPDALRVSGTRVHVNLDMVAADALSLRVLLSDLARLYREGEDALPVLNYSYPRYLAEYRANRAEPGRAATLERDRIYWQARLPNLPAAPVLPTLPERLQSPRVVRRHRWLDAEAKAQLERKAFDHGLTPAMAMAAILGETLTAYSAEADFLLNLPLFDREPLHAEVGSIVGDFTSSILLVWQGGEPGSFVERARRLQTRFHQDVAHASYSGVEVLRDASRLQKRQLFAPVVFTSALGLGDLFGADVRKVFGEPSWIISQGPQVWLDAQVTELNGGILVNWDARESAFAPGVLDAMFQGFSELLDRLLTQAAPWDEPVAELLPQVQRQVRVRVNTTSGLLPEVRLHDGLFKHAVHHPEAPALLWGDAGVMCYGELAKKALGLAAQLQRQGVCPGDVVAVSLPKGPQQIVAVLGVLAAGAAYLPLNIDHPPLRRKKVLDSAVVRHVIENLTVAEDIEPLAAPVGGTSTDLAYVLYTSGSTGEPKGVEMTHQAAMNTITDLNERFTLGPVDRTLAVSALDFDLSVFDIFSPLAVGGAVVCVEDSARRDAAAWTELLRRHKATVLNCVPTLADMLITASGAELLALRLVLLGGDWVPLTLPGRLAEVAPNCRCIALGGTTETAIHSTIQEVLKVDPEWASIPYGTPLRNVQCRVVDALGRDRPDHVPGELWIGGAGVARGYRGDAPRTADRFVTADGLRWYRTGDLACYLSDGTLEFLGRIDHQVKILGQRIELGEIETALDTHHGVERGIAVVEKDHLAAAVVPAAGAALELPTLRAHLAERLPTAMIPGDIIILENLPLSANGKVDRDGIRRAIAESAQDSKPLTPPQGKVEQELAAVWRDVLDVAEVSREHNFFALGGDSLQATRLIARLRASGFAEVRLGDLFATPVFADFATNLRPAEGDSSSSRLISDLDHRYEPFPTTDVQRAYLFGRSADFTLGGIGCYFYREYDVEELDIARLENAINHLIGRHEMLRAVFDEQGRQRILPKTQRYTLRVTEAGADPEIAYTQLRAEVSHRVFDPGVWPLFAIEVVRDRSRARVGIGIDNLILDALSILIFYRELDALYQNPGLVLAPISVSFRDYVLAANPDPQVEWAAWDYWNGQLEELPPGPQLPLAVDPANLRTPHFTRRERQLDKVQWQRLQARARNYGITPSSVLLNAYAQVLGRWSARADLTLNVTLFDRKDLHPDINRVLGDFTSLVLVASQPQTGEAWLEGARRIQAKLWDALDHREVSVVRVLRELARSSGESEVIMPVVFTSALGVTPEDAAASGMTFGRHAWGVSQTPQVWLDHQVTELDGGVCLTWDAVEELFPQGLLDTLFDAYLRLLDWLIEADWQTSAPDLMPPSQRRVREQVNTTGGEAPERLLHGDFFAQACEQPQRDAICWRDAEGRDQSLSYGVLAGQALKLAGALHKHGVVSGDPVGITLSKGPAQVVAVLGVLAAGAVYVPFGVNQPAARRDCVYHRAGVRHVLTDAIAQAELTWPESITLIVVDEALMSAVALPQPADVNIDDLAYVIFTSGSTGEPKGVEITHRSAVNTVLDVNQRCALKEKDRVLAVSALDFDLSVYDLFGPLSVGAATVLVNEADRREAGVWLELIQHHRVTVWNSVPALLDMLLIVADGKQPPDSLRVVLVSGDWVGLDLPQRLAILVPRCRFLALGGATEASIWSNIFEVERVDPRWRSIPYGRPLRNQRYRVVDAFGRDCPDFVSGELWIGGAGVARGYRGQPELTARSFLGEGHDRWYRTGDLGRYWPDGNLEFLGRVDQQVKLRGHRIELGEIEAALRNCPGVGQAVATVHGEGSGRHLVAAVVPAPGVVQEGELRFDKKAYEAAIPVRGTNREREAEAVESVLMRLLDLPALLDSAADAWDPVARLEVTDQHLPVLRLWMAWLVERGLLQEQGTGYTAGARLAKVLQRSESAVPEPSADPYLQLIERAYRRLLVRLDDYRAILAGRLPASVLLEDDVLAPDALSAADPGTQQGLREFADEIAALAAKLGRPVDVLELGGHEGRNAERVLDQLSPEQVRYTLADTPALIAATWRRLAKLNHQVGFETLPEQRIPDDLCYRFDCVLAVNVVHRYHRAAQGPALLALLTRRSGVTTLIERCELTPVAAMTAAVLDHGYVDWETDRRGARSPMLPGAQWAQQIRKAGFVEAEYRPVSTSFVDRVRARRPAQALDLAPATLRDQLSDRVPAHMVPERVVVLPWLPLSFNGKVNREALADLASHTTAIPEEAPSGEMEQTIATLWTELLGVTEIGRHSRFFELGGDSLQATRFLAQVRERFGIDLPLRRLFAAPALADVAKALERERTSVLETTEEGSL